VASKRPKPPSFATIAPTWLCSASISSHAASSS
jgi:hypothetical protein